MYRGTERLKVDSPPEVRARKNLSTDLIRVHTDGTLSGVVVVKLVNNSSFLATRINDSIMDFKEPPSPLIHFLREDFLSFIDSLGQERLVYKGSIAEIVLK